MFKKQFSKFLLVGLGSTAVNYGVFLIFLNFSHYLLASAIGFIAGVFFGFFLNKNWTFSSSDIEARSILIHYFAVYLFSLCLSLIFLRITVGALGIPPQIANFLAICLTTCTNFIGTKFFVFKK